MQMTNSPTSMASLKLVKESQNCIFFSEWPSCNVLHFSKTDFENHTWVVERGTQTLETSSVSFHLSPGDYIRLSFQCNLHV